MSNKSYHLHFYPHFFIPRPCCIVLWECMFSNHKLGCQDLCKSATFCESKVCFQFVFDDKFCWLQIVLLDQESNAVLLENPLVAVEFYQLGWRRPFHSLFLQNSLLFILKRPYKNLFHTIVVSKGNNQHLFLKPVHNKYLLSRHLSLTSARKSIIHLNISDVSPINRFWKLLSAVALDDQVTRQVEQQLLDNRVSHSWW